METFITYISNFFLICFSFFILEFNILCRCAGHVLVKAFNRFDDFCHFIFLQFLNYKFVISILHIFARIIV